MQSPTGVTWSKDSLLVANASGLYVQTTNLDVVQILPGDFKDLVLANGDFCLSTANHQGCYDM